MKWPVHVHRIDNIKKQIGCKVCDNDNTTKFHNKICLEETQIFRDFLKINKLIQCGKK